MEVWGKHGMMPLGFEEFIPMIAACKAVFARVGGEYQHLERVYATHTIAQDGPMTSCPARSRTIVPLSGSPIAPSRRLRMTRMTSSTE